MADNIKQELPVEEVVNLLADDVDNGAPKRKGYADYLAEAKKEAKEAEPETESEDDGYTLPEKFEGKSVKEVAKIYSKLESEYGRRNTEVGSLRKLTDELLELKQTPTPVERPKIDANGLLENPDDTINNAIDNSPRLQKIEAELTERNRVDGLKTFEEKYPDWKSTLNSDEFGKWINASPVRQRMLVAADRNNDYEMGAELMGNFDVSVGRDISDARKSRDDSARKDAKSAVTEQGGAPKQATIKKYYRTELIHMKIHNPQKYAAMSEDIKKAYSEGNVI